MTYYDVKVPFSVAINNIWRIIILYVDTYCFVLFILNVLLALDCITVHLDKNLLVNVKKQ